MKKEGGPTTLQRATEISQLEEERERLRVLLKERVSEVWKLGIDGRIVAKENSGSTDTIEDLIGAIVESLKDLSSVLQDRENELREARAEIAGLQERARTNQTAATASMREIEKLRGKLADLDRSYGEIPPLVVRSIRAIRGWRKATGSRIRALRLGGLKRRPLKAGKRKRFARKTEEEIRQSGLVDFEYYLAQYPDVREAGMSPIAHYVRHGASEGRNPNPFFNTLYYVSRNPDITRSGVNPLLHYVRHGAAEGWNPSAQFDAREYVSIYPDVAKSGMNPLSHYLRHGRNEGRRIQPVSPDQRLLSRKGPIIAAERQKQAAQIAKLQKQYSEEDEVLKSQIQKLTRSRWHKLGRRLGLVKSGKKVREKLSTSKNEISSTSEIGSLVERIYQLALHRNPSSEDRSHWTRQVLDGRMGVASLVEAISTSPEAEAVQTDSNILPDMPNGKFVQLAYESLIGRGAMADEIVHWDHKFSHRISDRSRLVNSLFAHGVTVQARPERNDPSLVQVMGTDKQIGITEWQERKDTIGKGTAPTTAKAYPSLALPHRSEILVSAIASLYRGGDFIDQFLQNITSQTIFESYCELVIIDAASPENEFALIASYMKRFPNIVYHRTPTRIGIYEAWNLGIEKARGKYVTNTNLDDLRRSDSFERQAEILEKFPFVDVVYQDFYYSFDGKVSFDETAAVNARSNVPIITPYNLMRSNYPHNAPMWRRALHRDVGLFDASYQSAGDYEFWLRCVRAGKVFYKVNDPHVVYFVNPKGVSTQPDTRGFQEANRVTREHARDIISPKLVSSDDEFLAELSKILEVPLGLSEPERNLPEWRFAAVQRALRLCSIASRGTR